MTDGEIMDMRSDTQILKLVLMFTCKKFQIVACGCPWLTPAFNRMLSESSRSPNLSFSGRELWEGQQMEEDVQATCHHLISFSQAGSIGIKP